MLVVIIDYGLSNLGSIRRAIEECRGNVIISDDPNNLKSATHIILPGVGAFKDGINNLRKLKFDAMLKKVVLEDRIPLLGICLGMQLLAEKGFEGGEAKGLGFISGEVKLLKSKNVNERIPHIGWNEVWIKKNNPLFFNIPDKTDFYFVHSYHFIPRKPDCAIAETPYCKKLISAVMKDNIFGVQFHPEKSQYWGFQILNNFLQFNTKC